MSQNTLRFTFLGTLLMSLVFIVYLSMSVPTIETFFESSWLNLCYLTLIMVCCAGVMGLGLIIKKQLDAIDHTTSNATNTSTVGLHIVPLLSMHFIPALGALLAVTGCAWFIRHNPLTSRAAEEVKQMFNFYAQCTLLSVLLCAGALMFSTSSIVIMALNTLALLALYLYIVARAIYACLQAYQNRTPSYGKPLQLIT